MSKYSNRGLAEMAIATCKRVRRDLCLCSCRTCGKLGYEGDSDILKCPVGKMCLERYRPLGIFIDKFNPNADCDQWEVK